MADLSPAAQAVYDAATAAAIRDNADWPVTIAAALRAAADLERSNPWGARIECAGAMWMRDQLLAIAAELEANS